MTIFLLFLLILLCKANIMFSTYLFPSLAIVFICIYVKGGVVGSIS